MKKFKKKLIRLAKAYDIDIESISIRDTEKQKTISVIAKKRKWELSLNFS